jgi:hydrogenase expression/formation protein HypC
VRDALYADAHTLTARCATILGLHGTESLGCANLLAVQYAGAPCLSGRVLKPVCLAIPVRVTALLEQGWAEADIGGVMSRVCTALLDAVAVGDYLIVHAGFAITRLDVAEAELTLALFAEITAHYEGAGVALHPRLS